MTKASFLRLVFASLKAGILITNDELGFTVFLEKGEEKR